MSKNCIGFILVKEYPNCRKKLGYFEPFTTGEFLKYPEYWRPVYKGQVSAIGVNINDIQDNLRKLADNIDRLNKLING